MTDNSFRFNFYFIDKFSIHNRSLRDLFGSKAIAVFTGAETAQFMTIELKFSIPKTKNHKKINAISAQFSNENVENLSKFFLCLWFSWTN